MQKSISGRLGVVLLLSGIALKAAQRADPSLHIMKIISISNFTAVITWIWKEIIKRTERIKKKKQSSKIGGESYLPQDWFVVSYFYPTFEIRDMKYCNIFFLKDIYNI